MTEEVGGVWRTVSGRRIFIKDGESLTEAMKKSGKFKGQQRKETKNNNTETGTKLNDKDMGISYKNKLKKLKGKPDGTYDLDTGKPVTFKDGYNVSFEQSTDNYSSKEYYAKIKECAKKCDGKVYGGNFGGDAEISFYTKDIKVAKEIMYKYNQHSIWSNELGDIIKNEKYNESQNKTNYKGGKK